MAALRAEPGVTRQTQISSCTPARRSVHDERAGDEEAPAGIGIPNVVVP